MNDLNNTKFPSGLTYDESMTIAEKYIDNMSGSDYKWMAVKYFGELVRSDKMWRNIANDILSKKEAI
jgi:hypothetical protein